jgi:hypothetical protein
MKVLEPPINACISCEIKIPQHPSFEYRVFSSVSGNSIYSSYEGRSHNQCPQFLSRKDIPSDSIIERKKLASPMLCEADKIAEYCCLVR